VPGALETRNPTLPVITQLEAIPAEPQDLGLLIEEVNALTLRLKQAFRVGEDAGGLLSATQCVLRLLLEGPKTVPQLARLRGTSRQNVQTLVNRLRRQGFVILAANPAHRRSALVTLTEPGKSVQASAGTAQDGLAHAVSPRCSQSEVRSAVALLRRLRDSITERPSGVGVTAAVPPRKRRVKAVPKNRPENPPPFIEGVGESSSSAHELPVSLL